MSTPYHLSVTGGAPGCDAVRRSVGVAGREDRARIRLHGKDPVRMIQGLITNDLAGAPPGRGVYAAVLTPKGRIIAELRAFRLTPDENPSATEVLLDLPREALPGLREHLRKSVPPMFARWEEVTDRTAMLGAYGPRAAEVVGEVLGVDVAGLEEDALREVRFGTDLVRIVGTREAGGEVGYDLFVAEETQSRLWPALLRATEARGGREVSATELETLRIEAGRPRYGAELSEEVIPTEAYESIGWMERAISFTKGCYTGQEVIVRIAHRGHVNRLLRGLLLPEDAVPGAPLLHAETGKPAGRLTSVIRSPLMGEMIGLGYLRREIAPGATVRLGETGDATARVVALPFSPTDAAGTAE